MDLTTTYMGMKLRSPLVPSASQSEDIDNIKRSEDAGAGTVLLRQGIDHLRIIEQEIRVSTVGDMLSPLHLQGRDFSKYSRFP